MTSGQRALRRGLAITVAVLVVVGCGTDPAGLGRSGTPAAPTATVAPSTTGVVDVSGTELTAGLVPFTECDELLRHLRAEATERVGPYGLDGGWFGGPVALEMATMDMAMADGAMTAPAVGMARSMEEGVDYSGTNV
ncbi:MAG: hypothetical protein NZ600_07710, partial [Acidimicrobiales bacterium]|nr:hypothetical protein [Acidimicrobiales bacterium]